MNIKKIAIIGPESTGKSTLSEGLAIVLHTSWVPEFARTYLELLDRPYTETDLLAIAKGQMQSEDKLMQDANEYLICDTDLYVLKVWSEHKYGRCDPWILAAIAKRKYDLYLLTYIDIEWQPDTQREHPDAAMRQYFYNVYKDILIHSNVPWAEVRGTPEVRLQQAVNAVINKLK